MYCARTIVAPLTSRTDGLLRRHLEIYVAVQHYLLAILKGDPARAKEWTIGGCSNPDKFAHSTPFKHFITPVPAKEELSLHDI